MRRLRFWSLAITAVALSIGALFLASQIAHDRGQSVDWYTGFGQWLGALGSFVAAGAALWISLSDRRHNVADRARERDDAAEAQARLVQVEVIQDTGDSRFQESGDFIVYIDNYGDRAAIGAAVTRAWMLGHPEYTWQHSDINHDRERIVRPARESAVRGLVRIQFRDDDGNPVPKLLEVDGPNSPHYEKVTPPDAVICFMDADGMLWKTGTSIPPERVTERPTSLDPGGPTTR